MTRTLVVVAVAAVVVAVGVVIAVTLIGPKKADQAVVPSAPQGGGAESTVATTTPAGDQGSGSARAPSPDTRSRTTKRPAETPRSTGGTAPTPPVETATTSANLESFVSGLNQEQEQKLWQLLSRRQMERARRQAQYSLPSEWRVQALNWQKQPELKLNEGQQQQINGVKEALKPRLEAALREVWARNDQISEELQQISAAQATAGDPELAAYKKEQMERLYREMSELNQRAMELKKPFDDEFVSSVTGLLTPEQVKSIESVGKGYGERGQVGGGPGGGAQWTGRGNP